jgi:hypothetical protein
MDEHEAEEWLGAAVSAIGTVRIDVLDRACLTARRTCTHHSQIVPAVIAEVDSAAAQAARLTEWEQPVALPAPRGLSRAEFDELIAERGRGLSVAIDRGEIISNGDGTFRLPDEAA